MTTRVAHFAFCAAGGKPVLGADAADDELDGLLADVIAIRTLFKHLQHHQPGVRVMEARSGECFSGGAISVDPRPLIQRWMAAPDVDLFVLIYSGHGQPGTGDWLVNEIAVRPMDVFRMWEFARRLQNDAARLLIVADTCHAGMWLDSLRSLPDYPWNHAKQIAIQSACLSEEKSYELSSKEGSVFLVLWCRLQHSNSDCRPKSGQNSDRDGFNNGPPTDQCPCIWVAWDGIGAGGNLPVEVAPGIRLFGAEYFSRGKRRSLKRFLEDMPQTPQLGRL